MCVSACRSATRRHQPCDRQGMLAFAGLAQAYWGVAPPLSGGSTPVHLDVSRPLLACWPSMLDSGSPQHAAVSSLRS